MLLKGKQPLLRSKAPALVAQEVYGLLLAHFVARRVMAEAAAGAGVGPARLSYKHSLEALQDRLTEPVRGRGVRWQARLLREVGQQRLRPKRARPYPRVKKGNRKRWPTKEVGAPPPRKPSLPFAQAVEILGPRRGPPGQTRQPPPEVPP